MIKCCIYYELTRGEPDDVFYSEKWSDMLKEIELDMGGDVNLGNYAEEIQAKNQSCVIIDSDQSYYYFICVQGNLDHVTYEIKHTSSRALY